MATNEQDRLSTALLRAHRPRSRCVLLGTVVVLSLSLLWTGSAAAEPGIQATSSHGHLAVMRGQSPIPQAAPNEFLAAATGRSAAAIAAAAARSKKGARYVYGAAGPNAFDCSGLTYWAWARAGVKIPRTSRAQSGLPSVPLSKLRPGDLVTYYRPVHHVAMYIGNGQVIHASTTSRPVYITTVKGAGPYPTGHRVKG